MSFSWENPYNLVMNALGRRHARIDTTERQQSEPRQLTEEEKREARENVIIEETRQRTREKEEKKEIDRIIAEEGEKERIYREKERKRREKREKKEQKEFEENERKIEEANKFLQENTLFSDYMFGKTPKHKKENPMPFTTDQQGNEDFLVNAILDIKHNPHKFQYFDKGFIGLVPNETLEIYRDKTNMNHAMKEYSRGMEEFYNMHASLSPNMSRYDRIKFIDTIEDGGNIDWDAAKLKYL